MKPHWILLAAFVPLITGTVVSETSSSVTTESLVLEHGYPYEEHQVQTSDGYILGVHRIPYSSRVNTTEPRPIAFLMHGLLGCSSNWILQGPENALAYILSDAGYDVWLGNARGNTYSREHVTLSPQLKAFWDFEWHDIGMIDLPAMIDYVLSNTGENQVTYFGHSQGTTTFLLLNSLNLDFKSRIRSAHLLAPVAFVDHMESPLAKVGGPLLGHPNTFVELFGSMEFMPNSRAMEEMGYLVCNDTSPTQEMFSNILFIIAGFDEENLNRTLLTKIMATIPAGSSINQVIHFLQEYNSGHFRQFDCGWIRNLITYGSINPPRYPLEKVDVPIFLYYGQNDYLSAVVDVQRLILKLPVSSLMRAYEVPHPKWNHLDHLWGLNVRQLLYDVIMEDVESMR